MSSNWHNLGFLLGFLLQKWETNSCDRSQRVKLHLFLLDKYNIYLPTHNILGLRVKKWDRVSNDTLIFKNHQIVSPISNSESTNLLTNIYSLWFSTGKSLFFSFFPTAQREKNWGKKIGENIWWICGNFERESKHNFVK